MANRDPKYSWVYQELTKDDGDDFALVNNIAYIVYKKRKIDFFEACSGNPTEEEKQAFYKMNTMPSALQGFREQAQIIVTEVLNSSLQSQINEAEIRLEAKLTAEMKSTLTTLNQTLVTNHIVTDTKLNSLTTKDWKWWGAQLFTGTVVTFLATVAFWVITYALVGKGIIGNFENNNIPQIHAPIAQ